MNYPKDKIEATAKVLRTIQARYVEWTYYWYNDEGELGSAIVCFGETSSKSAGMVPGLEEIDWADLANYEYAVCRLYPDGRITKLGNAYMPEPEVQIEKLPEEISLYVPLRVIVPWSPEVDKITADQLKVFWTDKNPEGTYRVDYDKASKKYTLVKLV